MIKIGDLVLINNFWESYYGTNKQFGNYSIETWKKCRKTKNTYQINYFSFDGPSNLTLVGLVVDTGLRHDLCNVFFQNKILTLLKKDISLYNGNTKKSK